MVAPWACSASSRRSTSCWKKSSVWPATRVRISTFSWRIRVTTSLATVEASCAVGASKLTVTIVASSSPPVLTMPMRLRMSSTIASAAMGAAPSSAP